MNEKERDRSSDGAGPSAPDDGGPCRRLSHLVFILILTLITFGRSYAQTGQGLSVSFNAGVLRPDNFHSDFYRGIPSNANTVMRILGSEAYGHQIWTDLTNGDLITSNIDDYRQLSVAEYGEMSYRIAVQLGVGFRYEYGRGWGWMASFDYARLHAVGQFLLNSGRVNSFTLTNKDAYVACPIAGLEERVCIDLGLFKKIYFDDGRFISLGLGVSLNNTKVEASDIEVAGRPYSILDIWNGRTPDVGVVGYEYVNQGGLGYGGFGTLGLGLMMPDLNSIVIYYTFYYTKINLEGYESFAPQHLFGLRFELGNFSFFDKV